MNKFLALPLAASLLLASCGGGSNPTTPSPSTGAGDSLTSDGTATAVRSFVLDRSATLAGQSLNSLSLHQQDTFDYERLRVVLNVERVKSGASQGQRRAAARIIWAQAGVKLSGPVTITLFDRSTGQTIRQKKAALALDVTASDFQAAKTLTTGSLTTGAGLCARLSFGFSTSSGVHFDNTAAPLEVCESQNDFTTTINTLTTAAKKAMNTTETVALTPFKVEGFSGMNDFPTGPQLRQMFGVPANKDMTDETAAYITNPTLSKPSTLTLLAAINFFKKNEGRNDYLPLFGPEEVNPTKNLTDYPQYKRLRANRRAQDALSSLVQTYGFPARSYFWDTDAGHREAVLVGLTAGGVFAIRTTRLKDLPVQNGPQYWPLNSAWLGWTSFVENSFFITVAQLRYGSDVHLSYSVRPALACGAAADGAVVRSGTAETLNVTSGGAGLSVDGVPTDDGLQVSYTVHLVNAGQTFDLGGEMCAGDGGGVFET